MTDRRELPVNPIALAPIGARLLAFAIDSVLVAAALLLTLFVDVDLLFLFLAANAAVLIYFVVSWSRLGRGQTIGMRVTSVRLIRSGGGDLGIVRAVLRYVGLEVSFMFLGLPLLPALLRKKRQAFHDTLADTLVVTALRRGRD